MNPQSTALLVSTLRTLVILSPTAQLLPRAVTWAVSCCRLLRPPSSTLLARLSGMLVPCSTGLVTSLVLSATAWTAPLLVDSGQISLTNSQELLHETVVASPMASLVRWSQQYSAQVYDEAETSINNRFMTNAYPDGIWPSSFTSTWCGTFVYDVHI